MTDHVMYSATARGFFDLSSAAVPSDAVQVTRDRVAELMEAQAAGAEIRPGDGGAPIAWWPAQPSEAEVLQYWRSTAAVSAFQAKAALFGRGLLDDADAVAVAAGGLTLLAWQTATTYQRLSPAITNLAPLIGITDPADLDDLFREAAAISA